LAFVGSVRLDDRNRPSWLVATSVLIATSERLEGVGARYFEGRHDALEVSEALLFARDVNPWASDPDIARRLRDVAAEYIGSLRAASPPRTASHASLYGVGCPV
jgi:hypothetical protein